MLAPACDLLTIERRPLATLGDIIAPWRDLAARAAEPNVFYDPDFALAAAPVFGRDVDVVLVWSGIAPRRLVGLFPFRFTARRFGVMAVVGWTHRFAPLGTPLVDRDAVREVVAGLLDHAAHDRRFPELFLFPFLNESGPVASAIMAAVKSIGGVRARFGCHRRALLAPGAARAGYVAGAIGAKRRKELRRQRQRLGDSGPVTFECVVEPDEVARAVRDFLALEAAGWKGRAGTAIVQDMEIERFVATAIGALAARNQARAARLWCGPRPVAVALVLTSADAAWGWKVAYDEAFARASPGVQLFLDLTEALLADPALTFVDSCAVPEHPMIDHIWRERRDIGDWLIGLRPGVRFEVARRVEAVRRRAGAAARALRNRLLHFAISSDRPRCCHRPAPTGRSSIHQPPGTDQIARPKSPAAESRSSRCRGVLDRPVEPSVNPGDDSEVPR